MPRDWVWSPVPAADFAHAVAHADFEAVRTEMTSLASDLTGTIHTVAVVALVAAQAVETACKSVAKPIESAQNNDPDWRNRPRWVQVRPGFEPVGATILPSMAVSAAEAAVRRQQRLI